MLKFTISSLNKMPLLTALVFLCFSQRIFAIESPFLLAQNAPGGASTAPTQSIDEETYDPFSDYSEFDENSDEEADVNFFKNGRFLSVGFQLGAKGFTDNLATAYQNNGCYGFFLSYFFDMRVAIQLGYSTSDNSFTFSDQSGITNTGNVSFGLLQVDGKYYINTQNLSKSFGELNPYVIMGLSNATRTYTLSTTSGANLNATASAWGLDGGGGLEIPIMKKKAYAGVQFVFHYTNFSDSSSPFPVQINGSQTASTLTQKGYQYDILGVLGVNF